MENDALCLLANQKKQQARLRERADRMSRLKEVAVGEHTEEDVQSALAKISEASDAVPSASMGAHAKNLCRRHPCGLV